jgi:hypothetical protein
MDHSALQTVALPFLFEFLSIPQITALAKTNKVQYSQIQDKWNHITFIPGFSASGRDDGGRQEL